MPAPDATPLSWDLLRGCRPLAAVSESALRDLFAAAETRTFQAGEALVRQGDPAEGLLIVLEGAAHARLRDDTGDHFLAFFTAGDIVGEMALVTREPRSADVIADSRVRALLVPTAAFDRLAVRHLELGVVLTQLVADRLGQGALDGFGGKMVEGFRILRCVGRGGMSVVYRAEDRATGELVALKMMSYRLIYDASALARFRQEAELVHGLAHENIARLRRLFPAYHTYFLVMELCDGLDLHKLVRARGPLPEAEVRPIIGQLARALEHVHARGLVHRDLKPANVMITRTGQVKLTDFGLAMPVVVHDSGETRLGDQSLTGTPAFMAPEQLAGAALDHRTDIYALGCLVYDLFTGERLFGSRNLFELVREKMTKRLPPPEAIGAGVSPELYDFMERALRVHPDDRPSSVSPLTEWAAPCQPPPEPAEKSLPDAPLPGQDACPTHD